MFRFFRRQLIPRPIGAAESGKTAQRQGIAIVAILTIVFVTLSLQSKASDPTAPPASMLAKPELEVAERPPETLRLQAIFVSQGRRVALVNGERLHEGDRIGTDRVGRISANAVKLYRDDEVIELQLVHEKIKRAAPQGKANQARQGPTQ